MSFQAYLDTIKAKTGLGPDDLRALAAERGLIGPATKAAEVIAWLDADYGLGRGHAMAVYAILKQEGSPRSGAADKLDALFAGERMTWRPVFDALVAELDGPGTPVAVAATDSYVSLLRGSKKFGIVGVSLARLDIGVKLPGVPPTGRLAAAGSWNTMVTHRVQITDATGVDTEVIGWLRQAYAAAGASAR